MVPDELEGLRRIVTTGIGARHEEPGERLSGEVGERLAQLLEGGPSQADFLGGGLAVASLPQERAEFVPVLSQDLPVFGDLGMIVHEPGDV